MSAKLPTWGQLMLPLIDTIEEAGPLRAKDACQAVAGRLNLLPEIRDAYGHDANGKTFNLFDRRLRWVRQSAVGLGLIESIKQAPRGLWRLTDKGAEVAAASKVDLGRIRRGTVVTLYTTGLGRFLWGYAEDVAAEIEDGSVHLLFTSPPYPLHRKKEYGNLDGSAYLDWLEELLGIHLPKLAPDGAILLNLGEAYLERGSSEISPYREEITLRARKNLGLKLFGKYYWHNPSKPPSGHWVTHAKCRPKNDTEEILWLAKNQPQYFGDAALQPYSASMLRTLRNGGEKRSEGRLVRPSGHGDAHHGFAKDRGGSWPGQTIKTPNADSQGEYFSFCRQHKVPSHPARFPEALARRMLLTHSQENQLICDPCGGSGTTAAMAETLGRRWISCDRELAYALGTLGRFQKLAAT